MRKGEVLPEMDYSRYIGEWIVVFRNKVIAHNKDLSKISKDINNCKGIPTVAKIAGKETWIF